MAEGFSNNYQTTLNGGINNSVTSLVVVSATGAPSTVPFRIIVKAEGGNSDEIMTVTAVSGTTYTVTRASESVAGDQTAYAHSSGATVAHILTAGALPSAGSLVLISETILGANAASITFTAIPSTYRDLVIIVRARSTDSAAGQSCWMRVGNGSIDSGSNYSYWKNFQGWTSGNLNSTSDTKADLAVIPNSGGTTGFFGSQRIELLNYADAAKTRTYIGQGFSQDGSGILYSDFAGSWKNTSSAIDQLQILAGAGNLLTGSAVTLYGRI